MNNENHPLLKIMKKNDHSHLPGFKIRLMVAQQAKAMPLVFVQRTPGYLFQAMRALCGFFATSAGSRHDGRPVQQGRRMLHTKHPICSGSELR
ncbi:hypothetical protein [Paraburkholderia fungorum]|uniref:hypothetical protein n=1 Tax=Paraburkholderia fungorum TaxID=134537 RepID=UPI0011C480F9|nr:hypothetical protein [Paraburkholderia fungorum]